MKRSLIVLIFLFSTYLSFAQFRALEKRNHNVNKLLKEVITCPEFKTAGFAFLAVDLQTGKTIAKYNPDMALKPASTLKLFSTATILELLGPDFRFETNLAYSGQIDTAQRILHGDIVIRGGGDPSLGSVYFDETKNKQFLSDWVKALKAQGIDSIAGQVVGDARAYSRDIVPATWSWQNMGNYFGAGPCGLTIFDNYYSIYFNTSGRVGDTVEIAKVEPEIPEINFDNSVTADSISYDNAYIFGAPYNNFRYIRGQLPLNKINFRVKGSMPDPAYIAALQLESALKNSSIKIKNPATTKRLRNMDDVPMSTTENVFHTIKSPKLADIIRETNTHSINLFAEHCLVQSGITLGAAPETDISTDSLVSFWKRKGMDTQGLSLFDGSGLSMYNAVTPNQMVYLLKYMKKESKYFDTFYESMAIAGKTGTLRRMFKETVAKGKLRAKSGTVNKAKAYAGYVTSVSGRDIAFSIVVNNFSCSSGQARAKLEELMVALAEFEK